MDIFTHALIPYLLGRALGRSDSEVFALVIGGIAPDLDVLISWIDHLYPTAFLLVHRGITHSLPFGILTAAIAIKAASTGCVNERLGRRMPPFTTAAIAWASLGVLIHLSLDMLTTRGVPLLYPLDPTRWSLELFFYSETALTIVCLAIIVSIYRLGCRRPRLLLSIVLLLLVVLGGVRMEGKMEAKAALPGSESYPRPGLQRWDLLLDRGSAWEVYGYTLGGNPELRGIYPKLCVTSSGPGLDEALSAAAGLASVQTLRWRAYAVAANATRKDGAWQIEYYDPLMRADLLDAPPLLRRLARGRLSLSVSVTDG
ncbi:MAG: metal-dependent hydrolase [Methanotrichaceae archaeon]|nr:metal-dependent hydrolase [Methanotrichaceae archaeon]